MDNNEIIDWLERTYSDYNALVAELDAEKIEQYAMIRNMAKPIKDNLDELAQKVGYQPKQEAE